MSQRDQTTVVPETAVREDGGADTASQPTVVRPWQVIVEEVRQDCDRQPDEYLEQTIVPLGGE